MTNSQLFKAAHALAKTYTGNYRACFALALRNLRKPVKMTTKEHNIAALNDFINNGIANEEILECYIRVDNRGIVWYKNANVIKVDLEEGRVYSRQQFGCHIDDANFLRKVCRELPAMLRSAHEII